MDYSEECSLWAQGRPALASVRREVQKRRLCSVDRSGGAALHCRNRISAMGRCGDGLARSGAPFGHEQMTSTSIAGVIHAACV